MSTELPTKVGPYYWRESDVDEWEMWHVLDNGEELTAHRGFNVAFLPDLGGQWLPIPTADELVELRAKAKMAGSLPDRMYGYDSVITSKLPEKAASPTTVWGIACLYASGHA
jgi:hypothetical protein